MSTVPHLPVGRRVGFACAWCGEPGEIVADPSGGRVQRLIEDCWVCCRPNALRLVLEEDGEVRITVERED